MAGVIVAVVVVVVVVVVVAVVVVIISFRFVSHYFRYCVPSPF